jgi:hypothetical protein
MIANLILCIDQLVPLLGGWQNRIVKRDIRRGGIKELV